MVTNLGVLISGRGSNFENIQEHILKGNLQARITCLISNTDNAAGLAIAKRFAIPSFGVLPKMFESTQAYEEEVVKILHSFDVEWVVLAGYMKLVKKTLLHQYENRILNIHPSLLPAFKGLNAQEQAINAGVKVAGCTVHFVNEDIDAGTIVDQLALNVEEGETSESLSKRILALEHILYPAAIKKVLLFL